MNHTCHDCHAEIPRGLAVRRSITFEPVTFHKECWALRLPAAPEPVLPVQRVGGTLSERIARASA